ncbi:MAG: LysR family transcriptional regulator [Nevskia sp.]|nr:LysR family transcriptional regulator [Nevskia sp.]
MSSITLLMAFAESAKQLSFARAARELGLSPSAVAKNVGRLERDLGLRLFHRTTRRVGLTPEGEDLFERCRKVLDDVEELEGFAAGAGRAPGGSLRLNVPVTYGRSVVMPLVARLVRDHPAMGFDIRLSDDYADIIGGGFDAVIRIGAIRDSALVARTIDHQELGVYASGDYLARRGVPRRPEDLESHDRVVFRMPATGRVRPWQFRRERRLIEQAPPAKYAVNEGEALVEAAALGLGLVQMPTYIARAALEQGRLREVLEKFRPARIPISLVFPSRRHVPPRLRLLIDSLLADRGRGAAGIGAT